MNPVTNGLGGLSFGVGFAIGTRIVEHYKDIVDDCLNTVSSFVDISKKS